MLDSEFFQSSKSARADPQSAASKAKLSHEQMIKSNAELVSQQIDMGYIDLIIQKSFNLDQDAIIKFIQNLCKVSRDELSNQANPRKFSL